MNDPSGLREIAELFRLEYSERHGERLPELPPARERASALARLLRETERLLPVFVLSGLAACAVFACYYSGELTERLVYWLPSFVLAPSVVLSGYAWARLSLGAAVSLVEGQVEFPLARSQAVVPVCFPKYGVRRELQNTKTTRWFVEQKEVDPTRQLRGRHDVLFAVRGGSIVSADVAPVESGR